MSNNTSFYAHKMQSIKFYKLHIKSHVPDLPFADVDVVVCSSVVDVAVARLFYVYVYVFLPIVVGTCHRFIIITKIV